MISPETGPISCPKSVFPYLTNCSVSGRAYNVWTRNIVSTYSQRLRWCWPLVPKFVGSNPAEAVGFF